MLDESISCSPGNNGKKLRSRKFHKASKIKCQHLHTEAPKTRAQKEFNLEALYEDDVPCVINKKTYFENLCPFENEKLLVAADCAKECSSNRKLQSVCSTGFLRLGNLSDNLTESPSNINKKPPETELEITELVGLCKVPSCTGYENLNGGCADLSETDENTKTKKNKASKSIVEEILADFCGPLDESGTYEKTPPRTSTQNIKGTRSIVDDILEDFCGSPNIESSPKISSNDSTPIFRFKSQPIRTYSGIRKKKLFQKNMDKDLNVFINKDDGHTSDSSSELSVQEDLTQSAVPQLDSVDLNNSVKLCENLLNLSSYFSQLPKTSDKSKEALNKVDDTKNLRLSVIVEEIIKLKSKSMRVSWNNTENEFEGFSDYENDSKESTLQELLEDEDDVLQQINCDSLCYSKIDPKVSFEYINSDIENTLQNASAVIDKAKKMITSEAGDNIQNPQFPLHDDPLFDDVDIWNDNECLLYYKTQNSYPKTMEDKNNSLNDEIEVNKTIRAKTKCATDLEYCKNLVHPCSSNLLNENYNNKMKIQSTFEIPVTDFVGFSTASKKPIFISDISKERANNFIKEFQQQEEKNSLNFSSSPKKKDKNISKQSLEIEDFGLRQNEMTKHAICETTSDDMNERKKLDSNCFEGFYTASKKVISISNEAKQKAGDFLMKFEQDENAKKDFQTTLVGVQTVNVSKKPEYDFKKNRDFIGFSTASEKPIAISLNAQCKAKAIMKKFEDSEKQEESDLEILTQRNSKEISEEVHQKANELLLDIEFFEEVFEDELQKIEHNPMIQVQDEKRKIESNTLFRGKTKANIFDGFKTVSHKPIPVSEEASRRAEIFLKNVVNEDIPNKFIECIDSYINENNISRKDISNNVIKAEVNSTITFLECDSKNSVTEFRNLDLELLHNNSRLHNLKCENIENKKCLKRKHCETQEVETSNLVTSRRLSYTEQESINLFDKGVLCKSSSMPIKECSPHNTIISRKNLLSLSKRRKTDSPGQRHQNKSGTKTPEKDQNSSINHFNVNSTPNLRNFFESVSTSTPRLTRNVQSTKSDVIDSDFRRIPLDSNSNNNSFRINRTGCVDDLNVTLSQVSPSPKQRIEVLKIYGEPPPISPISMVNKCRPSGLRRGRSLMKP